MIDLTATLRELRAEKYRIDLAIEQLSLLQASASDIPRLKRGRKAMGEEERQEVSRRMRDYWARHRRPASDLYSVEEEFRDFPDQDAPI
jgi:hypothetical protein